MAKQSAFGGELTYRAFAYEGQRIGIERDLKQFRIQINLFSGDNTIESQRAASVLHHVSNISLDMFHNYLDILIHVLKNPIHDSGPRLAMRVLKLIDIPEVYAGICVDLAFSYLNNIKTPVAIKVYSMVVIANQAAIFPELLGELEASISSQYEWQSPAFKSSVRNINKKLGLKL